MCATCYSIWVIGEREKNINKGIVSGWWRRNRVRWKCWCHCPTVWGIKQLIQRPFVFTSPTGLRSLSVVLSIIPPANIQAWSNWHLRTTDSNLVRSDAQLHHISLFILDCTYNSLFQFFCWLVCRTDYTKTKFVGRSGCGSQNNPLHK